MSPTYTAPAIETIHQGEQLFTADFQPSFKHEGPRERTRPLSSWSDQHGRKHRSGSPQVHPLLKASPGTVTEDSRRASHIPVRTGPPGIRRHASVDFSALKCTPTGPLGIVELEKGPREPKRLRLSPSPKRPTPLRSLSSNASNFQSESSGSSNSTITESCREDPNHHCFPSTEYAPGINVQLAEAPSTTPEYLGQESEARSSDDINTSLGYNDAPAWTSLGAEGGRIASPTPRSCSSVSSISSSAHSAASSQNTDDTEASTGDETPVPTSTDPPTTQYARSATQHNPPGHKRRHSRADPDRYGTPEMPRGPAKLPHLPVSGLTPRVPNQSHPKYLPRAEKLPMSGYELLAATISSSAAPQPPQPPQHDNRVSAFLDTPPATRTQGSRRHSSASMSFFKSQLPAATPPPEDDCTIKPIYRRFESLNHRLLLHLQDELSELEEQLHRLDTTDTQTRRLQSSILPASRRAEFLAGGELQWHKTDILSKIAFKLGQYNQALSSFTSTRDLPAPSQTAVAEYRDYLSTHRPISDVETRFLDSTPDLITLEALTDATSSSSTSASDQRRADNDDEGSYLHSLRLPDEPLLPIVTPIPGTMHGNSWLLRHNRLSSGSRSGASGSSEGSSAPSPKFRTATVEQPLASPSRLPVPPSPLRQQHRAASVSLSSSHAGRNTQQQHHAVLHLALAMAVAVLVPVLVFSVIPGFVGRMMVVTLVGVLFVGSFVQVAGAMEVKGDLVWSGGVYVGVMAVVAGVMA